MHSCCHAPVRKCCESTLPLHRKAMYQCQGLFSDVYQLNLHYQCWFGLPSQVMGSDYLIVIFLISFQLCYFPRVIPFLSKYLCRIILPTQKLKTDFTQSLSWMANAILFPGSETPFTFSVEAEVFPYATYKSMNVALFPSLDDSAKSQHHSWQYLLDIFPWLNLLTDGNDYLAFRKPLVS